jgi:uncharacterized membrane protein
MSNQSSPTLFRRARLWMRDSVVAGLIATVPLIVVWWVLDKVVLSQAGILSLIPPPIRRQKWSPPWLSGEIAVLDTPGLGFLLSLLLIMMVGALFRFLARGALGRAVGSRFSAMVRTVPILGTLYSAVQQLLEAIFSSRAQQFQRVVLVQFPRAGAYCLGFLTARAWEGASEAVGRELVSVFVPTTPNPTSGFFVMFDEEEVTVLDMTVEEAFKAIMSSGIVPPARGGVLMGADPSSVTSNFEKIDGVITAPDILPVVDDGSQS